ncbi:MAG: error-prone DNA polymerase [Planctomycetia bacterium]|nr:error-prone DNA polymerase [Planctomycetia bacterium]
MLQPPSENSPPALLNPNVCAAYAEVHCISNFSFLQGASHPEELVMRAAALGYSAIAITDCSSVSGVVRAHVAAKQAGIHLLVGATIEPVGMAPLVLWSIDRKGYGNLCRLLTRGYQRGEKDCCLLELDDVAAYAEGLMAGMPLTADESTIRPSTRIQLERWRELFVDRFYAIASCSREGNDERNLDRWSTVTTAANVPIVAAGNVRYHVRSRMVLADVLSAVRHGCTVQEARDRLLTNGERHLHPRQQIAERFRSVPGAIERTIELANRCTFSLDELRYEYPDSVVPSGRTPQEHLAHLVWMGGNKRYPDGIPEKVCSLIQHELLLVNELKYESYFLTVFDLVRFARRRGILCQGRGSAANSAICYCLGITSVDPSRMDVLFERFISRERSEAPDIDIDFEHARREEVIQYLYKTYGRHRAGMTAEVIRYRLRSAVRDVGKSLGLSLDRIHSLARVLDVKDGLESLAARLKETGFDPDSDTGRKLLFLVGELIGFPRHLGQHVGGMVITRGDLCELVPIQKAAMNGRTIVQWNKDDLDELGILKIDCLALGMLTAIGKTMKMIHAYNGINITMADIPAEDPQVYDMICSADTVGVFQIESRAQMSMLPRLKPRCFYDLVIEVAIVRPGPIQGDMVHPYLRRRAGEECAEYPSEAVRAVLEKTLGVPLFQEQAMRLAVVAAGFTPGEADELRRAMGAWRRPGVIDEFRRRLVAGMQARGLSEKFSQQVFQQIRGFGEYGFPESHAASFALLVYVSAWLKCHHPAAFTAALLASQPMGFYAPAQLVRDAQLHGVEVRPPDIQWSGWHACLEGIVGQPPAVRLGLQQIHGLGEAAGMRIEVARRDGSFISFEDLARRARIDRAVIMHVARAGAMQSLGKGRRIALWQAMQCQNRPGTAPLFESLKEIDDPSPDLPVSSLRQDVLSEYRTNGVSLRGHPIEFERKRLDQLGCITNVTLRQRSDGEMVWTAGIVLMRQRPPTAKGIVFVTIEDETAAVNVVVRSHVWQSTSGAVRRANFLLVQGRIERRESAIHVIATRLEDGSNRHDEIPNCSRDFQ